ncbi:MAG: DUF4097 domain-containing protein [bacterium]|nr:DUF4097 domain-containing protein [bacterium]
MKKVKLSRVLFTCLAILLLTVNTFAQNPQDEKIELPLTNPDQPAYVSITWQVDGDVQVIGYDGTTIEVQIVDQIEKRTGSVSSVDRDRDRDRERQRQNQSQKTRSGLRKLNVSGSSLNVNERNNRVTINNRYGGGESNVVIRVPRNTNLNISSYQDVNMYVQGITGEIEAKNSNGDIIELMNVSGTVHANCLNGDITVEMDAVDQENPMSFRALNGDIDVTFPADMKATFTLQSRQGEVLTDYENLDIQTEWEKEESKSGYTYSKISKGLLNGGGIEITFNTYNGDIIIRKK